MTNNFFLVFEGMDGSGKTEISRRLSDLLYAALGTERVLHTYEPHNPSAAGEYIRDVLGKRISIAPRTLALAFALNRADHNERVLTPFLQGDGRVVVCDRYIMSSLVYNSGGGLSVQDVAELNKTARTPDLTLYLDAMPETSYERISARQLKLGFAAERELFEERLTEKRDKYFSVINFLRARGERIEVVDANGTLIEVLNGAIAALNRCAPDWLRLQPVSEAAP